MEMNQNTLATLLLKIDELKAAVEADPTRKTQSEFRYLKFTEKEISQMPKNVRKLMRIGGYTVHARKRQTGRYRHSIEIRYRKNGYNISVSATTEEEVKRRFLARMADAIPQDECFPVIPTKFDAFAVYWFENFHQAKVIPKTYRNNYSLYCRHIREKLKSYPVRRITPMMLKNLLSSLPGNGKTEEDVRSILNQILDTAVSHGLIKINPLVMIVNTTHERESGVELTREEEFILMQRTKGTPYEISFALMLYAGLRPCEFETAYVQGNFIVSVNSKRKGGKIEYKKIPIISFLRMRIEGSTKLITRSSYSVSRYFHSILPNHTMKDLRKTFSTQCANCHVEFYAREKMLGHSCGKLDKTYTGNLDKYLLEEAQKLEKWYDSPQIPPEIPV